MVCKKHLFCVLLMSFLVLCNFVQGQDRVKVQVNLHGFNKDKLTIHFHDGVVLDVLDLNQSDSIIIVDKPVYTHYPTIRVTYDHKFDQNYFIASNTATLNLFYNENRKDIPFYSEKNVNLTAIYDSVSNKIYRDLRRDQGNELADLNDLFRKHGHEMRTNDSVKYELANLIKRINTKSMYFLKPYANDFFSFYYFKDQLLGLTEFIERDSEYYIQLLQYYNNTFPEKFRNSNEGKQITTIFGQKISPVVLKETMTIPTIHFKDSDGETIFYKGQKEDFVLLDFWASWCGPCVQQIPDIKILREQFPTDKLKIVSISIDRDSISYTNGIKKHKMDWIHGLDRGGVLSDSLGISSVPTVLLLDRNGKIVYYKNGGKLDIERIRTIIRED